MKNWPSDFTRRSSGLVVPAEPPKPAPPPPPDSSLLLYDADDRKKAHELLQELHLLCDRRLIPGCERNKHRKLAVQVLAHQLCGFEADFWEYT